MRYILPLFIFLSLSCDNREKVDNTSFDNLASVVKVEKARNQLHLLFTYDVIGTSTTIPFLKEGEDSIYTKVLNNSGSIVSFLTSTFNEDTTITRSLRSFFLKPGDTAQVMVNGSIENQHGEKVFWIDSLINVPYDFYIQNQDSYSRSAKTIEKYRSLINVIEKEYTENKNALSIGQSPNEDMLPLHKFNAAIKYIRLLRIQVSANDPLLKTAKDNVYTSVLKSLEKETLVDYFFNDEIYKSIIHYFATKDEKKNNIGSNIWSYFDLTSNEVKSNSFYKNFLYACLAGDFKRQYKNFPEINKILQSKKEESPLTDSLYQLSAILMRAKDSFDYSKKMLQNFENGKYAFLLETDEKSSSGTLSIQALPPIPLYDFKGKAYDFKELVTKGNQQLTLIDFWASWCAPCIDEIPHLKKMEKKFKDKKVRFISISIDKKEAEQEWIAAAKKHGLYNSSDQYIMPRTEGIPLQKLLNITTIPRFVLIDKEGNIVNADFYRPGSGSFEIELLKILNDK